MSWSGNVIWWHCYPLRFVDAEDEYTPEVTHRLGHLANWLDYVIELGANGLLLAPVFASSTHGYDTLDHFRIDPRLGDNEDFAELVRRAGERGIRVVLDGVFNHVSRDHEIVQRALASGPDSEAGRWLHWVGEYPRCFEGHMSLVELNLGHPGVQDYVVAVMNHWLDCGVDGWRLDAAYAPGADAWRPIVERVKAAHPDSWVLAEVLHGDYSDFVTRSGVDSITQYELWKAIWSSLNDPNFHELAWALKRHAEFCQTFLPQTFIGNHDVTRIATKLTDPRHVRLAIALLLLLPGIPSIYAGDEQGFTGEKLDQSGGDDAVRPPFPLHPAGLAPFGADILAQYQRLIHQRRVHPWLATATATANEVTNGTATIDLVGDGARLTLALNATDQEVRLPGSHATLIVHPHDWALG
jgi:cyclomaltodextrinase / maltogenic alpha-amylase / neopullulanase